MIFASIAIVVGWILCGIFTYRTFRWDMTKDGSPWMTSDRTAGLFMSTFGPIGVCVSLVAILEYKFGKNNKPAKW